MSQDKPKSHHPRSRRCGVEFEEEKAWVGFYRHAGNPAIAAEVLAQLDSDQEMKRAHLALYMRCKESLRTQKIRQARNKRVGQAVRMLCRAVFVAPAIAVCGLLRGLLGNGRDIAVECLPQVENEPGVRQAGRVVRQAEFARAQSAFDGKAAMPPAGQENAEAAERTA